jgi:gamma-glutamyltranspeptidase/glutathione hydrolase
MKLFLLSVLLVQLSACSSPSTVREVTIAPREQVEAHGKKWMVSTQGKYATEEAAKVLRAGGSVIDAAIVASLVIGVERPHSTGLGGGGFLIYHEAKSNKNYVIDFRERAPLQAHAKMYLDQKGEVIKDLSVVGPLAVGVPGMVRGLEQIHARFSKTTWAKLVKPAQNLAQNGFVIYPSLELALEDSKDDLSKFSESKAIFLHEDGTPYQLGERLVQKNLARTLGEIAKDPESFYRGPLAKKLLRV